MLKWTGKEFCPNEEIFMTSFERKLIEPFKETLRLRQDSHKRRLTCTGENGKCEMLILL